MELATTFLSPGRRLSSTSRVSCSRSVVFLARRLIDWIVRSLFSKTRGPATTIMTPPPFFLPMFRIASELVLLGGSGFRPDPGTALNRFEKTTNMGASNCFVYYYNMEL